MSSVRHRLPTASALAALAASVLFVAGGCAPSGSGGNGQPGTDAGQGSTPSAKTSGTASTSPEPGAFALKANVDDGAKSVKVDTVVKATAAAGSITDVTLTGRGVDAKGRAFTDKVTGKVNDDKSSWTAGSRLEPGGTYTLTMTGQGSDGAEKKSTATFTTKKLSLDQQTYPEIFPNTKGTYGVATPVVIRFDLPVKNRKEFQQHMTVTSSPKQEGTWSWLSSTEVHYRPKNYWKPGTKVSVDADLNSLDAGKGIYGQQSRQTAFTIGQSVVTTVNLKTHQAKVVINGKLAKTLPVSGGKPGFTTRSGTKVITEKLEETKMASETVGIAKDDPEAYNLDVKYAMRITNSGEFIHAAPWNAGNFGRVNASHGCVGLSTENAGWLFRKVNVGDPVIVTGTNRGLEQGNGFTDWNISYAKFKKGSAE